MKNTKILVKFEAHSVILLILLFVFLNSKARDHFKN